MPRMIRSFLISTCAALLALSWALPAHAQQDREETFKDWTLTCRGVEVGGSTRDICRVHQKGLAQNGQPMVVMEMGYEEGKEQLFGYFTVPLGVALSGRLRLAIDDGKTIAVPFVVCLKAGCKAAGPMEDDFENALKAGKKLKVGLVFINGRQEVAELSLQGVTAAIDALKK
ncbi:MAG: invasion associated locus B family protein [Gammaproteobacteria bacterium]